MTNPKVTLGLPVYNGDKYLDEAIASLLDQTFDDFELLISDNGSTDRTEEICREWAGRDARIQYFRHEENRGGSWNFGYVFELARGQFFRWAAHDDTIRPTYIEACLKALEANPEAILASPRVDRIDETGRPLPVEYSDVTSSDPIERLATVMFDEVICFPIWGLMRTEVLGRTGLLGAFDSSDRVLLGELALHGTFELVDDVLFVNRFHPDTSMRAFEDRYARGAWFDPKLSRITYMPNWQYNLEWIRMIGRVGLRGAPRRKAYGLVLRWSRLKWRRLAFDPVRVVLEAVIAGCVKIIRYFQAYE